MTHKPPITASPKTAGKTRAVEGPAADVSPRTGRLDALDKQAWREGEALSAAFQSIGRPKRSRYRPGIRKRRIDLGKGLRSRE